VGNLKDIGAGISHAIWRGEAASQGSRSDTTLSIGYLSNVFPALSETFIYREVLEIRQRGIDVRVYSIRRPDRATLSKESMALCDSTFYLLPVNWWALLGCHIRFLCRNPCRYLCVLYSMTAGTYSKLGDRIRGLMHFGESVVLADRMHKDSVTHIHAHYASQTTSVARAVSLLTNIPYSFTAHAHDIWHDQLLLPEKLSEAEFVCCCSEFGRQWLMRQTAKDVSTKVHLVHHGVNVTRFSPPQPTWQREKNLVLSIGRLTEIKGFPDLITACAVLRSRDVHVNADRTSLKGVFG